MTRFDIHILGDERADIDGEPVVPAPGGSLHEAVLDRLQRSAQRLGRPVEATVDDGPDAAHFLLEVSPDGSSRILTTAPAPTGPKPSAPTAAPEPVSQSEPGLTSGSEPRPDTRPDAKTRAELGPEPEPESESEPEWETGLRPRSGSGPDTGPVPGKGSRSELRRRSGPEPESGTEPGTGTEPESGPESGSAPGAEPDTGSAPGWEAASEPGWPEQEAEPEAEAAAPGPRPRVRDSAVATAIARARAGATAATARDRSDAPPAGPPADSDARPGSPPYGSAARRVGLRPARSDAPPAGLPPAGSGVGGDVPGDIAERVVRVNALVLTGRLDEAFAEATGLRESLSGAAGAGHPYALEARALEAYVAHLRGDHRQATVLALSVARIRCGAGDERAPTEVARAAAAWQLLDDDRAVVVHGRELLGMWDGLSRRGPLPAGHTELAAQVRALVESLEAQRVLAPLA